MSDRKGSIKTIYLYDAFGQVQKEMGHVDNDFQFTGEQMDDETGLMYLRARYYDPEVGRFVTRDPMPGLILSPKTLNRYTYVGNNPINFVDPSGLWEISLGAKIGAMLAGGGEIGISDVGIFYRLKGGVGLGLQLPILPSFSSGTPESGLATTVTPQIFVSTPYTSIKLQNGEANKGSWKLGPTVGVWGLETYTGIIDYPWTVHSAGEIIDNAGNVYDSKGNIIGNLGGISPKLNGGGGNKGCSI
jgi:RHS repeat-associated protein